MTLPATVWDRRQPRRRRRARLGLIALSTALALVVSSVPLSASAEPTPVTNGAAAWGRVGDGAATIPENLGDITAIAAGDRHDLALRRDGTVAAWGGDNLDGQTTVPTGLTDVVAVAAALNHSLALRRDGTVVSWGSPISGMPENLSDVTAISAGYAHALALRSDGTVTAWGDNGSGQTAVPSGLTDVVAVSAGGYHSLALRRDGTVVAWGANDSGQTRVPTGLTDVTAISAGGYHNLALRRDGTVVAWGTGWKGVTFVPSSATDVVAISAGHLHSLALRRNGTVVAWGQNESGEGNVPPTLTRATGISAGWAHTLAMGPRPAFTADAPPVIATVGVGYSYTFGTADTSRFSVASGALPAGLTLDSKGVLTGTPTAAGTFTFVVSAQNSFGTTDSASHTINVAPTPVAPAISGEPPVGTVGVAYDFTYTVTGTPAPDVTLRSGDLPPGLTLDTTGRVTGTPTAAGSYTFTAGASNSADTAQVTSTITVDPAPVAPTITGDPADGTVGVGSDFRYTVAGTPAPVVSLASGTIPPGLTLDASGRLSGFPGVAGTYTFTVQATNSAGSAEVTSTMTIAPAPVEPTISGTVAAGVVGSPYDYTYAVTGTPAPTVSVQSGDLPPGLSLDGSGRMSGTPTVAGTFTFTVEATNSAGNATATSTVTISPQKATTKADLRVSLTGPATAVQGKPYVYTVTTKNAGPATSGGVFSQVILPPNAQFVSATGKYSRIGNLVVFSRSTLNNGQSVTEKITVTMTGAGKNTAFASTFSTKNPDPTIRNNVATASATVR